MYAVILAGLIPEVKQIFTDCSYVVGAERKGIARPSSPKLFGSSEENSDLLRLWTWQARHQSPQESALCVKV